MRVRLSLRRLLLWLGPVLVLIAMWQAWDAIERNRLERQIAQTYPEGLLDPRGSWEEDNAARYYTAASIAVLWPSDAPFQSAAVLWGTRDSLMRGDEPGVSGSGEAFALVARNQLSLDLVERGGELPFGAFRPDTDNYRFSGLIQVGQLLAMKTLDAIRSGDAAVAITSVIARIRLLRGFESEARLFDAPVVAREMQGIAADTGLVLTLTRVSDGLLEELSRALAETALTNADRLIKRESLARYEALQAAWGDRGPRFLPQFVVIRPVLRHHAVGLMQVTADARQAVKLPWPDRITRMNSVPERRSALPEVMRFIGAWRLQAQFRELLPRIGVGVAAARCARLAVALEQHRRAQGSFPPRLEDLAQDPGADLRLDPFTGNPLLYQSSQDGYVLYSVGPDARDDGGQVFPKPVQGRILGIDPTPDVGVRYINSASGARPDR